MINHTLYVSDLDGTLLGADRKVSPASVRLLNEAISRGALFSVATARTPATVSRLLEEVNCNIPLIVMTGAAIWDAAENRYVHAAFHKEDTARRLIALYERLGLSTFIYTLGEDNVIHIYHLGAVSQLERQFIDERIDTPYKVFHIDGGPDELLSARLDRVLLFYSMRPTDEVRRVYDEIKEDKDLRAVFYHDMYGEEIALMEVFGPGASKAEAVRILSDMVGADRLVAYGDNVNDLPILKISDDAVAVANAVEDVKRISDRVIGPNTDDSVPRDIISQLKG